MGLVDFFQSDTQEWLQLMLFWASQNSQHQSPADNMHSTHGLIPAGNQAIGSQCFTGSMFLFFFELLRIMKLYAHVQQIKS